MEEQQAKTGEEKPLDQPNQDNQQAQAAADERPQENDADATVSEESDHEDKQKPLNLNV